jgi:hypothetical protein
LVTIGFKILAALSVDLFDDVRPGTPYSEISL